MKHHFAQYSRYLLVALVAFVVTVFSRELFQVLLPADTSVYYVVSIFLAYTLGIIVNYSLQHTFTFEVVREKKDKRMFLGFVGVALVGAVVTALLALMCRYLLGFEPLFGHFSATAAFIVGSISASLVTYWLNARFVFS